jgi:hypothetical protein
MRITISNCPLIPAEVVPTLRSAISFGIGMFGAAGLGVPGREKVPVQSCLFMRRKRKG